ncbi:tryptophan/tyrosine permease family protein, partial [Vibrio harveyi]
YHQTGAKCRPSFG